MFMYVLIKCTFVIAILVYFLAAQSSNLRFQKIGWQSEGLITIEGRFDHLTPVLKCLGEVILFLCEAVTRDGIETMLPHNRRKTQFRQETS